MCAVATGAESQTVDCRRRTLLFFSFISRQPAHTHTLISESFYFNDSAALAATSKIDRDGGKLELPCVDWNNKMDPSVSGS